MGIHIYTDGSCDHHDDRRPGGWAFIIIIGGEEYPGDGNSLRTTNNQMELDAILEAMWEIEKLNIDENEKITIHSDSKWAIKCLTKKWNCTKDKSSGHVQWLLDIWTKISHRQVVFNKVPAHDNNVMNNRVNDMAVDNMEWARANLR